MVTWLLDIVKDNGRCRRSAVKFCIQLTSCVSVVSPLLFLEVARDARVQEQYRCLHTCTHTNAHTHAHVHACTHTPTHHSVHTHNVHTRVHTHRRKSLTLAAGWATATVSSWKLSPASPQLREALFSVTDGVVCTGCSSGPFGKKPIKNHFNNTILHQWN